MQDLKTQVHALEVREVHQVDADVRLEVAAVGFFSDELLHLDAEEFDLVPGGVGADGDLDSLSHGLTAGDVLDVSAGKHLITDACYGTIVDSLEYRVEQRDLVDFIFDVVDVDAVTHIERMLDKDKHAAGVELANCIGNGKRTTSEEGPDCGCLGGQERAEEGG